MKNVEIRNEVKNAGLKLWEIAEFLGIQDSGLSRKMRHELPAEEKTKIRQAIQELKAGEVNA